MSEQISKVRIGHGNWAAQVKSYTDTFDQNFWLDWSATTEAELAVCEAETGRSLPSDFRQFLLHFGHGPFPHAGGGINAPQDIVDGCSGPLYLVLGSAEWASEKDHRRFYQSRGRQNPLPNKFTRDVLMLDGVNLLDLLQIGWDGNGCYHQLYVGDVPAPFGYCLLTPESTLENRVPSFSEALMGILLREYQVANGQSAYEPPRIT